ncbi:10470_t:CDS:2, partial [Gigaspora margarita]
NNYDYNSGHNYNNDQNNNNNFDYNIDHNHDNGTWTKKKKTAKCQNYVYKEFSCGNGEECSGTIDQVIKKHPLSIIENPELVEILQYLNPIVELVKALQEVIINFGLMSGKHNRTNIANRFFKVLENYDIISKILAITLNNTANNNMLVQELETKLRDMSNIEWDSECFRFWCFNHIFNLKVQAALNCIKDNVNMIRELNSAIYTSLQCLERLETICNACHIKFIKSILDCSTH